MIPRIRNTFPTRKKNSGPDFLEYHSFAVVFSFSILYNKEKRKEAVLCVRWI